MKYLNVVIILCLFCLFGCGGSAGGTSSSASSDDSDESIVSFTGFAYSPVALSDLEGIVPPGSIAGGVVKAHSFMRLKESVTSANVVAATDATLVGIAYYLQDEVPLYTLLFKINDDHYFYYDHLKLVASKIDAVAPSVPSDSSATVFLSSGVFF
ncbi:MAG: hypothetical protein O3A01_08130 [bacterium]|nr:hypothetical protein [bacterium]